MVNDSSDDTAITETYKSPTETFKGRLLNLLFECISHKAKCYNDKNEKYAFASKTWDLSIQLERYTPASKRQELYNWHKQLITKIKQIREDKDKPTPTEKNDAIMDLEYIYAEEVHRHNQRIFNISPIIEIDVEGELDINDEDTIKIIREEKRIDDGKVIFKR